ncbi:hypothetical protein SKAU_G00021640, partial [Synaphobranchus kaupii]
MLRRRTSVERKEEHQPKADPQPASSEQPPDKRQLANGAIKPAGLYPQLNNIGEQEDLSQGPETTVRMRPELMKVKGTLEAQGNLKTVLIRSKVTAACPEEGEPETAQSDSRGNKINPANSTPCPRLHTPHGSPEKQGMTSCKKETVKSPGACEPEGSSKLGCPTGYQQAMEEAKGGVEMWEEETKPKGESRRAGRDPRRGEYDIKGKVKLRSTALPRDESSSSDSEGSDDSTTRKKKVTKEMLKQTRREVKKAEQAFLCE